MFDDREMAALQSAYDAARRELGIDDTDVRRDGLALLVFSLAESGIDDGLAERVIAAYREP
jgi:hypothetical protein